MARLYYIVSVRYFQRETEVEKKAEQFKVEIRTILLITNINALTRPDGDSSVLKNNVLNLLDNTFP